MIPDLTPLGFDPRGPGSDVLTGVRRGYSRAIRRTLETILSIPAETSEIELSSM